MAEAILATLQEADPETTFTLHLDHQPLYSLDEVATNLSDFQDVITLSLNNAQLQSLDGFPHLPFLRRLQLSDNKLSGTLGALSMLDLYSLDLANNDIAHVTALEPLRRLENLKRLHIERNPICNLADYETTIFDMLPSLVVLNGFDVDGLEVASNSDYGDQPLVDEEDDDDSDDVDPKEEEEEEEGDAPAYLNAAGTALEEEEDDEEEDEDMSDEENELIDEEEEDLENDEDEVEVDEDDVQAEAEADDLDDADEDDVIDGDEDDLEDEAEDPLAQMNSGMPGEVAPEDTLDYTDYDHVPALGPDDDSNDRPAFDREQVRVHGKAPVPPSIHAMPRGKRPFQQMTDAEEEEDEEEEEDDEDSRPSSSHLVSRTSGKQHTLAHDDEEDEEEDEDDEEEDEDEEDEEDSAGASASKSRKAFKGAHKGPQGGKRPPSSWQAGKEDESESESERPTKSAKKAKR